jgi:hypothetical protein
VELGVRVVERGHAGYVFRRSQQLGTGVPAGLTVNLWTVHDENGWYRGWCDAIEGASAVTKALGLDQIEGAEDTIGPVYDPCRTPDEDEHELAANLSDRLAAILVRVSCSSLGRSKTAEESGRANEA